MSIEKKIYSLWAYTENEDEKCKINHEIFEELKPKTKQVYISNPASEDDLNKYMCYECVQNGYGHQKYRILSNPHNFSTLQLALVCDKGNLCFGYRTEGDLIVIHTD